jgi:hypothetical protein
MAIDAYCHFGVTLRQPLTVDAGFILCQLVGAQRRVVLTHESSIGMALSTEFWNLIPLDLSPESCRFAHSVHVRLRGITTVATRAPQPFLRMNVLGKLLRGHS